MATGTMRAGSVRSPAGERRSGRKKWDAEHTDLLLPPWLSRAVVVVTAVIVLVPVLYMLLMSITQNSKVALGGVSFSKLDFGNYVSMWSTAPVASGLVHTVIISGIAALASVTIGLLAAYPLTRLRFRGRRTFLYSLLGSQTVPGTTLVLPLFAVFSWIQTSLGVQFIGGYWPIIVTYMTFGLPLSTWLLVAYLRTIPRELEEAGLVDGCTRASALRRIVLPMALPAVVVAFVFAFLVGWNDLLFASVLTNSHTETLAIVLQRFANTQAGTGLPLYGELMAAAVVSALPVVILYLVFQRYLVHGLSAGSMTGI